MPKGIYKHKLHTEKEINYLIKKAQKYKLIISEKMKGKFDGFKNPNWHGGNRDYYRKEAQKILKKKGINFQGQAIHHKNKDWKDNNFENLEVLTFSDHGKLHWPIGKKIGT